MGIRVTLDTVIGAWKQGATAEQSAEDYSSLALADIYAAVTYYLVNTAEVEAYLARRRQQAAEVWRENEERFPPQGIRARLLARRQPEE